MPRPRAAELAAGPSEPSTAVAARIAVARERPAACRSAAADTLLSNAVERLPLSGRGRARVARTARTIAALAQSDTVESEHIAEALAYRSPRELAA
jgi:magnesium chelatase family protein